MKKLADVIRLAERAQQRAPRDDSGFVARQSDVRRTEHLRRADPDIPESDFDAIRLGRLRDFKALRAVRYWWETSNRPFLALAGPRGTGKTVAGCWAIAEAGGAQTGAEDLWRASRDFRQADRYEMLTRCKVLLLDDLGTEKCGAEEMTPVLLHLVNRRQARGRRTILTCNMTPEQLRARYVEPRLWSRLVRAWTYVTCVGPDMRAQREPEGGER